MSSLVTSLLVSGVFGASEKKKKKGKYIIVVRCFQRHPQASSSDSAEEGWREGGREGE